MNITKDEWRRFTAIMRGQAAAVEPLDPDKCVPLLAGMQAMSLGFYLRLIDDVNKLAKMENDQ